MNTYEMFLNVYDDIVFDFSKFNFVNFMLDERLYEEKNMLLLNKLCL